MGKRSPETFLKRQREMDKKRKQQEKRARRQERKDDDAPVEDEVIRLEDIVGRVIEDEEQQGRG